MRSIMPIASDFGGTTILPYCHYFGGFVDDYRHTDAVFAASTRNSNPAATFFQSGRTIFLETVAEARKYPYFAHRPVFAAGTTPPPDRAPRRTPNILRVSRTPSPIIGSPDHRAPPEEERYVDMLFESGADLVGLITRSRPHCCSPNCAGEGSRYRKGRLGHAHYDRMLTYMVKTFGKGHSSAN